MNKLNIRLVHTHDTASKWDNLTEFIPCKGEIIVYDVDNTHTYERFKIGDGVTSIKDLPFSIEQYVNSLLNITDGILYADGGNIKDYPSESQSI